MLKFRSSRNLGPRRFKAVQRLRRITTSQTCAALSASFLITSPNNTFHDDGRNQEHGGKDGEGISSGWQNTVSERIINHKYIRTTRETLQSNRKSAGYEKFSSDSLPLPMPISASQGSLGPKNAYNGSGQQTDEKKSIWGDQHLANG